MEYDLGHKASYQRMEGQCGVLILVLMEHVLGDFTYSDGSKNTKES